MSVKIAHLAATNFFGGPEKQIVEHARRVNKKRFEIVILTFIERSRPNELLDRALQLAIPAKGFRTWNPFNPRVIFELASLLRGDCIDVLCAHGYKANVVGRIASRMVGIPEIAFSRGWTAENRKVKVYEELDKFFLRFADHVVAVSRGQRNRVLELGVAPDKVSVIYNGIGPESPPARGGKSIRAEFGIDSACCLVVSAGRLSPEKNFEGLIDAAKMVADTCNNVKFIVFGEGVLREKLERKIRGAGLRGIFFLPGFRKDFLSVLEEADIFVLPSLTEGFPNVILEAYALKKPVVATAVGGVPEVVQDDSAGFLVRPGRVAEMAERIAMLAGNRMLGHEMGKRGYDYLMGHFNFEIQTGRLEELYSEVYDSFHHHSHAC